VAHLMESTAIAPALKHELGYKRASELVEKARSSGRTAMQVAMDEGVKSRDHLINRLCESSMPPV
jgi:aspartate ammonia-lyase